ncbi:hypothetical protein Acsp04_04210 [Actinomadura sp. NBRC 104425]|uniref:hypothetical protein n=1 Tax=Actinomadura sp. NBRC 104425 TaxID=3032204 RepID=UPI00249FB3F6|nr:hypothetical protein [Actinomadura sp. NBRC 104425]GLZ10186.1 hypothetical protein Acsp04_04210 [Actinomadura sp. NBRC 104425]
MRGLSAVGHRVDVTARAMRRMSRLRLGLVIGLLTLAVVGMEVAALQLGSFELPLPTKQAVADPADGGH